MDKTKEVKVKSKKKLSKSGIVLIIGITIIAIPLIVFLSIILIAELQKGSPRLGNRFDNDLNPAISSEKISALESDLNTLDKLDSVELVLSEGQLRIYIDVNDNCSEKDVDNTIALAYQKVNSIIPITTYFTGSSSAKMYDLQINVYTTPQAIDGRQYKLLHKNSSEEKFGIDDLAHPKDQNLVDQLEGKTTGQTVEEPEEEKPTE